MDEECELDSFSNMPAYCENCKFKTDYDCRYEFNSTVTYNCNCWSKLTEIRRGSTFILLNLEISPLKTVIKKTCDDIFGSLPIFKDYTCY